jgi:hypothetical protein
VRRLLCTLALIAVAAVAAGCGSDDGGGGGDSGPSAASFVDCFELAGFEAVKPKPREESVLAFQAKREGYALEPVNVSKKGMLTPHAFLVFFASEDEAKEAMEKLNATSFGDVAPQQRGPVVIGYGDAQNRREVERAINGCL